MPAARHGFVRFSSNVHAGTQFQNWTRPRAEKEYSFAGSRPRQQRRPGPQGAQEEDAARGHFPRDETPRPLRKTIRKESAGKGGSDPPGPQARAQEDAA